MMKKTLVLIAVAVPTGIAVGAVDAVFGRVLLYLGAVRDAHTAWFLPFLGLIGALMAWAYKRYGAGCENGMGMVFEAGHAEREAIPLRLVPFVICATWLTHLFGGSAGREGVAVQLAAAPEWSAELALELTALGIVFGLTGAAFAFCLKRAKKLAQNRLKNPVLRALVMGVALSAVLYLLYRGRYCGLGTNLINASLAGEPIYAWDWALKLALTVLTLSAGFQGGEVTPLFSIGASLGAALAGLLGLPAAFCAALGYAAVFGSATNTLLAPALIGAEVFGWAAAPHFFAVCALAYAVNGGRSIYSGQK